MSVSGAPEMQINLRISLDRYILIDSYCQSAKNDHNMKFQGHEVTKERSEACPDAGEDPRRK